MNLDTYLTRLECVDCKHEVSLTNLAKLMDKHVHKFVFENLDMHMQGGGDKKIEFSLEDAYDRLMNQSRGGYCIQLNGLFAWLLKSIGYQVNLHPAYVFNTFTKRFFPRPLHLIPIVKFETTTREKQDVSEYFMADVATIRPFSSPVQVLSGLIQKFMIGTYKLEKEEENGGDYFTLFRSPNSLNGDFKWAIQSRFSLEDGKEDFEYFREMNELVQTPEHPIVYYRTILSRHCPAVTDSNQLKVALIGNKLIETLITANGDERTERLILDRNELAEIINGTFNIRIDFERFEPKDDYGPDKSNLKTFKYN